MGMSNYFSYMDLKYLFMIIFISYFSLYLSFLNHHKKIYYKIINSKWKAPLSIILSLTEFSHFQEL